MTKTQESTPRFVVASLWSGEPGITFGSMLGTGAIVWGLLAAMYLVINGVVMDETALPGMLIAGQIRFPAGHPQAIYYVKAFSLFNYLAAAACKLGFGPWPISALRNWLQMWLSLIVPFGAACLLTRKPKLGQLAASLMFCQEFPLRISGAVYGIFVWPHYASHGQIGVQAALLTVLLLLGEAWFAGGLLLGLLPSIHAATAIAVWPWAAAHVFIAFRRKQAPWRRLASGFLLGLLACGALGLVVYQASRGLVPLPPYVSEMSSKSVYEEFTKWMDPHRAPLDLSLFVGYSSRGVLFTLLITFLLIAQRKTRLAKDDLRSTTALTFSLAVFGGMIWAYVVFSWGFQAVRLSTPFIIQASMPGRLTNLTMILTVPLSLALGWTAHRWVEPLGRRKATYLGIAFAIVCFGSIVSRTVAPAVGLVLGYIADLDSRRYRVIANIAALLACSVLTICAMLWIPLTPLHRDFSRPGPPPAILAHNQEDSELRNWLDANTSAGEALVADDLEETFLSEANLGRPFLVNTETIWVVSYMPNLGSSLGGLVKDLYGIDYSNDQELSGLSHLARPAYPEPVMAWEGRSEAEWQWLRKKYQFRFVLAANRFKVNLPVALEQKTRKLYYIP